jgi:hypothetical protein
MMKRGQTLRIRKKIRETALVVWMIIAGLAACTEGAGPAGLNDGEGSRQAPGRDEYSANLIAKSDNTLSSQEKEMVLKEISAELEYIMNVVQSLEITDDDDGDDAVR